MTNPDSRYRDPLAPQGGTPAAGGAELPPHTNVEPAAPAPAATPAAPKRNRARKTTAGNMWVGLIVSALLLVVLLVFILQNQQSTVLNFFAWSWNFPVGVGMLLAAILGALITALIGGWRIMQLRRQISKS